MSALIDPLAEVVALLQPRAPFAKLVSGAGSWRVRRTVYQQPLFCVILDGAIRLAVDGQEAIVLQQGEFVLIPAAQGFTTTSLEAPAEECADILPVAQPHGEFRIGIQDGTTDVRFLVGHCGFGSPDAALLVSLLPQLVHIRDEGRLSMLVQLVREESRAQRVARDVILERLLEVLFIEALRSTAMTTASPGLVRGLGDERLAVAIRRMHQTPNHAWTVAQLAREAALSRSTFFERFSRAVGVAPMEYLLAWRMALAKNMLRKGESGVAEVAVRVGYGSASAFSVAFTRHVGMPPAKYAREPVES